MLLHYLNKSNLLKLITTFLNRERENLVVTTTSSTRAALAVTDIAEEIIEMATETDNSKIVISPII